MITTNLIVICKETILEESIDGDIDTSCERLSNAIIEASSSQTRRSGQR